MNNYMILYVYIHLYTCVLITPGGRAADVAFQVTLPKWKDSDCTLQWRIPAATRLCAGHQGAGLGICPVSWESFDIVFFPHLIRPAIRAYLVEADLADLADLL